MVRWGMVSKINIGPEDGPYVAINEENGNLQLEDNSGNVVAEWDETNAQWDFANNTLNNVDALNSNSVSADQATIGEGLSQVADIPPRPEVTNGETTVNVGNYDSIQDAINEVPRNLRHDYTIEIPGGDYSSEDLVVPPVYAESISNHSNGHGATLNIIGENDETWTVNSLYIVGPHGYPGVNVTYCKVDGVSPFPDEDASVSVFGGGWVTLGVELGQPTASGNLTAIQSYGSKIIISNTNFGDGVYHKGLDCKNGGILTTFSDTTIGGHTTGDTLNNTGLLMTVNGEVTATSDQRVFHADRGPINIGGGDIFRYAHPISAEQFSGPNGNMASDYDGTNIDKGGSGPIAGIDGRVASILVHGVMEDAGDRHFLDLILASEVGDISTVNSVEENNPDGRSYGVSGGELTLDLDGNGAGTSGYDIRVKSDHATNLGLF